MKLKILSTDASTKGEMELPKQFQEPVREDLVQRAVLAIQANNRQRYGADPRSGKNVSAFLSKRRRKYRGTYGIGQSRTPRKVMSRNGTRFNYTGAFAPQTVGGRRAHPPKASKIWDQKVNKTENRKAIRAALSATIIPEIVTKRGHKIPDNYPFIISDDIQKVTKTKDIKDILKKLGFEKELTRSSQKSIRAGKGKTRGRKYKTRKGILFVTNEECALTKAAKNVPGTDIVTIQNINAELLAPGAELGRVTLYTESAIKKITEEKLFTKNYKAQKTEEKIQEKKVLTEKLPRKIKKAALKSSETVSEKKKKPVTKTKAKSSVPTADKQKARTEAKE